jgi:predicted RNA-binding protein
MVNMNYWICVTDEENWRVIRDKRVWGVPEGRRRLIEGVTPGDLLVIYVKPKRIGGVYKAVSKPYESREEIFRRAEGEVYPYRVDLAPYRVPMNPVEAGEIMKNLSISPKGRYWTAPLRRGMARLSEEDYGMIEEILK